MTNRPAYFVISRVLGRLTPAIYWDELPRAPIRNLEYVTRLDLLPPEHLLRLEVPLARLSEIYAMLLAAGQLPHEP